MKNKYTLITFGAAVLIVISSYFLLALMTQGFLKVSATIHEETDSSDVTKTTAEETFMRCAYPLIGVNPQESKVLSEYDINYYLGEVDPIKMFYRIAAILGQKDINPKSFQNKIVLTTEESYIVMDATVNNGYRMNTAYIYGAFLGFYCRPTEEATEEQIKTAVDDLKLIIEKDNQVLEQFLDMVDSLNHKAESIDNFSYEIPLLLYSMMEQANEKLTTADEIEDFYNKEHSLYECYEYGNKSVLTDGKDVILLSSVGNCGLAVFYDPINKQFSGINLLLDNS